MSKADAARNNFKHSNQTLFMEKLIPKIKEIAEKIINVEEKRRRLARFVKEVNRELELIKDIKPAFMDDVKIAGIDGGIVKKSLHGFDCIVARAVAVCFHYKENKVKRVEYFPSRLPTPKFEIIEALSDTELSYFTSVMRLSLEIEKALESVNRFSPDFILLDGSILPHYADRPPKSSSVYKNYSKLIEMYKNLYRQCQQNNVILAGVIEDSRSTNFCNLIREEILSRIKHELVSELEKTLKKTRDTNLLFWALKRGERSMVFPYTDQIKEHPVLKDFGDLGDMIYSFYLKTAERDRPIRVDFIADEKKIDVADRISSVLLSISGHHSGYGLPAPLIEADNVAKLSENEMESLYSNILIFTGNLPGMMRLRREERPF